jgi:hypothetical protein
MISVLISKLDCEFSCLFSAGLRLTMWSNSLSLILSHFMLFACKSSACRQHEETTGHSMDYENVKILDSVESDFRLINLNDNIAFPIFLRNLYKRVSIFQVIINYFLSFLKKFLKRRPIFKYIASNAFTLSSIVRKMSCLIKIIN